MKTLFLEVLVSKKSLFTFSVVSVCLFLDVKVNKTLFTYHLSKTDLPKVYTCIVLCDYE